MLLEGKRGLVLGIANKRSIAWGIAQAAHREGARLAVTYQGERLLENVQELSQQLRDPLILPCDVTKDEDLKTLAEAVRNDFGTIDFVVHAVAFALREELDGEFLNTSREGYRIAQDISSYSLTALARETAPLMPNGGSIVTLSYLGGERVVPHYNVMGVAKAALEMSVRYLASDLGPEGHPRQRDLGRPDQDARGLGRPRPVEDARVPPHPRAAAAEHRPGRGRRRRPVPDLAALARHHGGGHPRGRRLPRDGHGRPLGRGSQGSASGAHAFARDPGRARRWRALSASAQAPPPPRRRRRRPADAQAGRARPSPLPDPGEVRVRAESYEQVKKGHIEARGFVDLNLAGMRIQADRADIFEEPRARRQGRPPHRGRGQRRLHPRRGAHVGGPPRDGRLGARLPA